MATCKCRNRKVINLPSPVATNLGGDGKPRMYCGKCGKEIKKLSKSR